MFSNLPGIILSIIFLLICCSSILSLAFQPSPLNFIHLTTPVTLSISYPEASIPGTNRYQVSTPITSFTVKTQLAGLSVLTSLPSFRVINCGVLILPLLSNSTNLTEHFNCNPPIYDFTLQTVSVKVYPRATTQFMEGTFVINIGLAPSALLNTLEDLLGSSNPVLSQIEVDLFNKDGMDSVLENGRFSPLLALNLSMPSFSVINPMLPEPSIDSQTGERFMPLKKSFFVNAKLTTKLKVSNSNIRYIWDVVKISDKTMEMKSSLPKRSLIKNTLGNFQLVSNYIQDREQTNQLGLSILTFSEDAHFEFDSVYRISCVARWWNSTRSILIGRSNDIYLRTPKRFLPQVAQPNLVFSVSPLVANMTTEFTFHVTAPFVYDDEAGYSSADPNLLFAFGYVNAKLSTRLTGGSDLSIQSGMSDVPTSELSQFVIQVTPYSSNRIHKTYLPPSFSLRSAETFNNSMILANAPQEYRQSPVLFVHDRYYGLTRVFILRGGMLVFPVPLETVYPFMEELKDRVNKGTVNSLQIKSLMGMVQKAYDGGNLKYIDLIQRSTFDVFISLTNSTETPIRYPNNRMEYAKAVSNVMAAAKILEMWSFNATQYLSSMVLDRESDIVNGIERFVTIIRVDARFNSFNGESSRNQPLGRIDSSLISSICASLSNIIQINQSIRSKLISSVRLLSASIVDSISPSEERTLTTDKLTFIIRKDYSSTYNTSDVVMGDSNAITVPKGVVVQGLNQTTVSDSDLFGTEYVLYSYNPNNDKNQANSSQIVSNVLSLRCIDNGGDYFPLSDLSNPILLNFLVEETSLNSILNTNNASMENITCRYWNETVSDWRSNGCFVSNYTTVSINGNTYYSINMKAYHTTQFAVFVELSQELRNIQNYTTEQKTAYHILWGFQIGIGVIIGVACLIMIVLLFIFRNQQPIKAKYVAPFIGMLCIFMDALLGSVTKSAVMIGYSISESDYSPIALNSLTYISSTILGLALSISVLAFTIQIIRYHLLRNMYALLQRSENNSLKFLKIITSEGIYILSVMSLFLFVFFYMGGMSSARIAQEAIDNSTGLTSRIYTIATSSFIGAILVLSLVGLSILFVLDLILSFTKYMKMKKSYNGSYTGLQNSTTVELEEVSNQDKKKEVITIDEAVKMVKDYSSNGYRFFVMDDPLLFRAETLLFIICLLILVTSYIFGIVNLGLFTSNYSAKLSTTVSTFEISLIMEIVRLVLTVIYFILYIFVFGGLSLIFYFKKYRNATKQEKDETQELFDLLNDELGCKLFENFCSKEFSLENLKCYREILKLKESTNLVKEVSTFRNQYLSATSPLEVNIPNSTRKLFTTLIEKPSDQSEYLQALETLKNDIVLNLSDTFSRFGVSNDYTSWQKLRTERERLTSKIRMSI